MSNADNVIAALRSGHDDLAVLVSGLSNDELARGSGASEWDVSQVLSHLGSGAEIARARVEAALGAGESPDRAFNQSVWDRWNAMTRGERAAGFLRANQTLIERYASVGDEIRIDVGFLPAPVDVATAARQRLNEFALHSWDVRVAFEERATVAPEAAAQLLHGEPNLIRWMGKAAALDGRWAVVRVTTTDPASVFALRLEEPISVDFAVPDRPDGELTLPAEAWLRLVAGRLGPRHTPQDLVATGAADLDLLRRVFPGY